MRIDKFLKVSRVLKRRSTANEACSAGKVFLNGKEVKPSREVKAGDIIEIAFGEGSMKFRVELVKETVKKEEASSLYTIL